MVLPDNVNPKSSILYLSSFILDVLKTSKGSFTVSSLFDAVIRNHQISIHEYLLCLDWLFLMNAVYADDNGDVELCL